MTNKNDDKLCHLRNEQRTELSILTQKNEKRTLYTESNGLI